VPRSRPAFVVDAFTDIAFRGNPAGVVLLDDGFDAADDTWLQQVATEFNHSETAFTALRPDGDYDLRWFTPSTEVDLCGHATLATSHVLRERTGADRFVFHTRSGVLHAASDDDGIALDFPRRIARAVEMPPGLADALGAPVVGTLSDGADLVVDLADAATVAGLRPDLEALGRFDYRGVVVTAASEGDGADFVSRFFGVRVGVGEDPVTGSAHCTLGPLWAGRLGRTTLTGAQLSRRGGRVAVEVLAERVILHGSAVTVLSGTLHA
jgi:predicted PhzF superfamily epimerase YddE/YHI9